MFCIAAGESGGGAFPLNNADRLPGGVTLHIHANSARAVPREEDSCSLPIAPSGPRNPRSQRATAGQARRDQGPAAVCTFKACNEARHGKQLEHHRNPVENQGTAAMRIVPISSASM